MSDKTFDSEKEIQAYKKWEESGAFACNPASTAQPFTVMMPPPNVTGSLHMGHALNMSLQDILTRYYRMRGRDALWQPGTDHAGIATQMVVERQLEARQIVRKRDLTREQFLEHVWTWKAESGGTIVNQLKRLGASPDWSRERFTMDAGLSKAVTKVFVQLYKEGLIYKDSRLVNWDPHFQTAISDVEVEQREQKGQMWHIRYPIEGAVEEFITVATTRPETLLGDTAIAVHPDDERYRELIGKFVSVPLTARLVPIIADEYSDPEKGSGAVKITPAHDFNDFEVGKRHNLPMINIFDKTACIVERDDIPPEYWGLERFEARKKILGELEEMDLLVEVEDVKNSLPYGDRSGVVIEPFLTEQWYCDAATLAKPAIEAVETGKTVFVPKNWENTYFEWMRNIQPWCISRQLWWGHQIPAWYDAEGNVYVAESEAEAQKQAKEQMGAGVELTRDEDVLDTWFSSALWPFSTLGWPDDVPEVARYYPGDVLVTGFDIIFFWVARMMMMGLHFMDDVPFKTVYIHALVRDAKGQKMSKSKGNVMDPLDLIDTYGADAVRFTLTAMAAQGRDVKLSEERVEGYRNFVTKLRNAVKYCEMNGCAFDPAFDPLTAENLHPMNQWIIHKAVEMTQAVQKGVEEYKFNEAASAIYQFVWGTFCDWFIEFSKDSFENPAGHNVEQLHKTASWVLERIFTVINPFMPFVSEELHESFSKGKTLLLASPWPDLAQDEALKQKTAPALKDIQLLQDIIGTIRSLRSDLNISPTQKLPLYIDDFQGVLTGQKSYRLLEKSRKLKRLARLESVTFCPVPQDCIQIVVGGVTLAFPKAEIKDIESVRVRLKKEREKLDSEIAKILKNLGNERFVANAPPEILEEQYTRKAEFETTHEKLTQALQQLEVS